MPKVVEATEYFHDVIRPILSQDGHKPPVSAFSPDGFVPTGTTMYESEALPSTCLSGRSTNAFSVTSARLSVRMLLSALPRQGRC